MKAVVFLYMDNPNNLFVDSVPENIITPEEKIEHKADPLTLDLDDTEIVKVIDKWHTDYQTFYKDKYNLFERRKKNEMYLFGKQITDKEKK